MSKCEYCNGIGGNGGDDVCPKCAGSGELSELPDLLPCPFCGHHAEVFHDTNHDYVSHFSYEVGCAVCCASVGPYKTEQKAVEHWNMRAR